MSDEIRSEFVQANGIRFHVSTCGTGDRLALLLHGFPESSYSWRHQLPMLARLGFKVWAPDLRGFAQTDKPRGIHNYSMEVLMKDVGAFIDASGCKSTVLIGHDWGGAVAWLFAIRKIRPLERLIAMNLPHPAIFAREVRGWRQLKRSWYMFFFQLPWLPEAALRAGNARAVGEGMVGMAIDKDRFPSEVLDVYRRNAMQPGAMTAMLNYYRAALRGGGGRRQEKLGYPILETPTLMIWGEADTALGKETTLGTEKYVSNLTLRYLPNVSHWVQQEAPETVNAMVEAWLCGRRVPEASELGEISAG